MISKLLSLLSTAKGAAAATVIAAAGVTGGVVATNPEVQDAVGTAVQNVTETVTGVTQPSTKSPKPSDEAKASGSAQPAVVAARNDADKKLREAAQDDQQKLEKLRDTKVEGADRAKLDDAIKDADAKLRDRLTKALNDVAALTLGREGLEASGSPKPSVKPSGSPDVKVPFTADAQTKVDAIVKAAIADMAKITADAEAAVALLPTFTPGKPSDLPGGKPSDLPGGKPSDVPGGKPSIIPPTPRPTPTR
ncbi:MAG: hypothetical protein NVS1B1_06930 [Candidatus Limnocylindrales bacterium]